MNKVFQESQSKERLVGGDVLQLVSFSLDSEEYGVDILTVQEINAMLSITRVPNAPSYVDGVIDLRGKVIPVVSLRRKFNLPDREADKQTKIVVVNLEGMTLGMVVDSVSEVLRLPADMVQPAPSIVSSACGGDCFKGIGKIGDRLLILLDLPRIFSDDLESLAGLAGN